MNVGHDPRAAVAEVLSAEAPNRAVRVPPPPRPAPPSAPSLSPSSRPTAQERRSPLRSPAADSRGGEGEEDWTPGYVRGRQRAITVHLAQPVRDLIAAATASSSDGTGGSKGQVITTALHHTWRSIERDFAKPTDSDDPFAPPVVRRRRALDNPAPVVCYLSESAAQGLKRVRDNTTLSLSAVVSEAVTRHFGR